MNIFKFLLYFILSIFNKQKRYVILTPNLLYLSIKKYLFMINIRKAFFFKRLRDMVIILPSKKSFLIMIMI